MLASRELFYSTCVASTLIVDVRVLFFIGVL